MMAGPPVKVTLDLTIYDLPQLIERLRDSEHVGVRSIADQIEAQTKPPKPETVSAHDGCHDKGWEDVDGVRYCVNCGWSEFARVMRELP